jgi:hypothetical protein
MVNQGICYKLYLNAKANYLPHFALEPVPGPGCQFLLRLISAYVTVNAPPDLETRDRHVTSATN